MDLKTLINVEESMQNSLKIIADCKNKVKFIKLIEYYFLYLKRRVA